MKTIFLIMLVLAMTLMGSFGSYFLKRASGSDGIKSLLTDINFYLGGFIYAASAVLNILLLRVLPYSLVLPLTSITYIWTMLISWLLLGEKQNFRSILGVSIIVVGVIVLVI